MSIILKCYWLVPVLVALRSCFCILEMHTSLQILGLIHAMHILFMTFTEFGSHSVFLRVLHVHTTYCLLLILLFLAGIPAHSINSPSFWVVRHCNEQTLSLSMTGFLYAWKAGEPWIYPCCSCVCCITVTFYQTKCYVAGMLNTDALTPLWKDITVHVAHIAIHFIFCY